MTCYHPVYSILQRSGSDDKWSVRYNALRSQKEVDRNQLIYDHSFHFALEDSEGELFETESRVMSLPCGKCLGCRLDYSRQWAQRCMCEVKFLNGVDCHFVTLTYDDDHLPRSDRGVVTLLTKSEFSKHLKRLRRDLDRAGLPSFRFYMCAEYGDKYQRPHYHVIFFGLCLRDLVLFDPSKHLYRSPFLEKWWPFGFVSVGEVTAQSVAYTARYCLKKKMVDHTAAGRVPEWTNCSNRPGIGYQYFVDHKDEIYLTDHVYQKFGDRVMPLKPARYFDKLYDVTDHDKCEAIKSVRRRRGEEATILKVIQAGKGLYDLLKDEEEAKAEQIIRLKRGYEEG